MFKKPDFILISLILATVCVSALAHFSGPKVLSVELLPITSERMEEQLSVRFSRPMKSQGFESLWSIEPNIPGRLSWSEGALFFTPEETIPAGQKIVIRIDADAQDVYGRKLGKDETLTFELPVQKFVFIGDDGQLQYGSLQDEPKSLTKGKVIRQFVVDGKNEKVWYLHQPHTSDPTQLWRLDLVTGEQEQFLGEKNFQIRSFSLARQGEELILLTQPTLAQTNEALSVYRFPLVENQLSQIELGELGLTLSSLSVPGDGNTIVATTLDGAQYLRTILGEKTATLTKIANYRGSNRAGTLLVFEDIVPDKNYAGEVVLYDGGMKRVTSDEATLLMPTISLDGKHLAYSFQLRSTFTEQSVVAGEALQMVFSMPVSGVRKQKSNEQILDWEYYDPALSFELPKFSPDSKVLAVEVFTKEQLQDLSHLREYGEPNKPAMATLRFFDAAGKLLPNEFVGRELQWVDSRRYMIPE